jgi:hypothetical protein
VSKNFGSSAGAQADVDESVPLEPLDPLETVPAVHASSVAIAPVARKNEGCIVLIAREVASAMPRTPSREEVVCSSQLPWAYTAQRYPYQVDSHRWVFSAQHLKARSVRLSSS